MKFKCYIIDLDGVVYKGSELVPGVDKKIAMLKKKAEVFFLTNNSTLSRGEYAKKLSKLGISTKKENIISSGYAAALYIKKNHPSARVFVVGESGLKKELSEQGLKISSKTCNVVVVGLDRKFNYAKLAKALKFIAEGATFVATNTDRTLITENGTLPGAGAVVGAVQAACGKKPVIVGKPSEIMAEVILSNIKARPEETVLIGDRLETDIAMGKKAGTKTALVLTGEAKRKDVEKSPVKPDYILDRL